MFLTRLHDSHCSLQSGLYMLIVQTIINFRQRGPTLTCKKIQNGWHSQIERDLCRGRVGLQTYTPRTPKPGSQFYLTTNLFLQIWWQVQFFQFKGSAFGHSAPWAFTKMIKPIISFIQKKGININFFILTRFSSSSVVPAKIGYCKILSWFLTFSSH